MIRHGKRRDFIEQMDHLLKLLSAKNVNIVPGNRACTDGKGTVYLPWLPEDASEEDFLKFFNMAIHEQAHFYGKTDVSSMSRNKTRHFFQNAVDDTRCERLQEQEYPGLVEYRRLFYKLLSDTGISKEFQEAKREDLMSFLLAINKLMIFRIRDGEIDIPDTELKVSPELQEAYDKYFKDLEPKLHKIKTFPEALEYGDLLYERMKELIREEKEKEIPEPPKPESKDEADEENDEEDEETDGENSSDSDSDDSGDSEETPKDTDKTGVDDDKGESKDEEEKEDSDESSEGDGDGDPEDTDAGSDGEEKDTSAHEEEDDPGSEDEDSESSAERSSDGSSGEDADEGTDEDDTGDSDEEGSSEDTGSSSEGEEDESPLDEGVEEGSEEGSEEDSSGSSDDMDEGGPERPDTSEDHSEPESDSDDDGTEDSGEDDPDPFGEYEEKCRERQEEIERAVQKALEKLDESDFEDIYEKIKTDINELVSGEDGPYMVDPKVKDYIGYKEETDYDTALKIRDKGLKMLGTAGSRMTRLFISQSRPRHLRNQLRGRFDMRSFLADPMDKRLDFHNQKIPGTIDKAAVSIMVDNSGSMRGIIDDTYAILSGMLHHLNKACVPTEVVGFTADTCGNPYCRDVPVYLQVVKLFEDAWDSKTLRRCSPPKNMHQNAELDCCRWMVPRLWNRPEKKKIFIVLGDGEPFIGSGPINNKLAQGYKRYLELCKEMGIIVFGLCIGCDLSSIFGDDCLSVEPDNVGDALLKKLTELLERPSKLQKVA